MLSKYAASYNVAIKYSLSIAQLVEYESALIEK